VWSALESRIREEFQVWRVGTALGFVILVLVCLARYSGALQFWEWTAFDYLLRLRPDEGIDERVVIVGISETDIQSIGSYPVPDRELAILIQKLQAKKPKVIGLDIIRNLPVEPGYAELIRTFKQAKSLIAIAKVLPEEISPPPSLPLQQIGFSDVISDADGYMRRNLLGTPTFEGYRFSFALQLAKTYLATKNITLENGIRDRQAMRFGNVELPRFVPNFGGYVGADAGGVQILLNFRSGQERFRKISLNQIQTGNFDPSWIRDRIVLIGITSPGVDLINSSVADNLNPGIGKIYGVEFQAHAVSQILSAVLDRRPLFQSWADSWEYLWILAWGVLGMSLGRVVPSPTKNIFSICLSLTILLGISYLLLILGWWIPVLPAALVLVLNGIGLAAFYQHDRTLRTRIAERQFIIDSMFDTIHNGPLQSLARILRRVRDEDLPLERLITELEELNRELRAVYRSARQEALSDVESLCLADGTQIDLQAPLHEILYIVYRQTLERDFPCFKTLKVKIRTFEPIEAQNLSIEQKRSICRFLEEALCNVGKHAVGVTRISAICTQKEGWCTICVTDNGAGIAASIEGRGTQQSKNLARQLHGKFERSPLSPRGTLCELTWRVGK
jgi:CHASE2 domain-containing sensor protein